MGKGKDDKKLKKAAAKSEVTVPAKKDKKEKVQVKAVKTETVKVSTKEKKSKDKPVKPAPPPKDDSSESSESESSDDEPKTKTKTKPAAVNGANDSDSDSSSESEDEKPKAQQIKLAKPPSSSSSSDSSDDEAPPKKAAPQKADKAGSKKTAGAAAKKDDSDSDSDSSDSSSEDEKPMIGKQKVTAAAKKDESSDSSGSEDDSSSDSDVEMADGTANGKRKAPDTTSNPTKKLKLANGDAAPAANGDEEEIKSIFVGQLSWSVDNDWLASEFASCGEVTSATVQMDRNTGKSRGFGYVHFATADAVEKALETMQGHEIDGRSIKIDKSKPIDPNAVREKRAKFFGDDKASPPSSTLFVGNLSFNVNEDMVWEAFNEYGVKNVRLPTDRETGRLKGFGYVEFDDVEGAKKAFEGMKDQEIDGRGIRLDYSQPRDSAGGGGRGGRGGFGDRGRGRGGFGDRGRGGRGGRGGDRGGRGRGGDRGWGGRGAARGNPRSGGIVFDGAAEKKKIKF